MKRDIASQLLEWKQKKGRKPLVLNGTRQVGKTTALKEFGDKHFDSVYYFNFEL